MSVTINTAMHSVAYSQLPSQTDNTAQRDAAKVTDQRQVETTSGGNTTVTLSDRAAMVQPTDYRDLAASKMVNEKSALEESSVNVRDSAPRVYASQLQNASNYTQAQLTDTASSATNEAVQNVLR
ncbi:MAG: hypothetical protein RBS36_08465 [Thiomicrospira sp.]|jgi:hypothetical protein|nr:hypothetical protein [Thiomicrospira sp.]